MKTLTYKFTISTRYVGSEVVEDVDIEVPDNATEEEIERDVKSVYELWVWDNTYGYYERV